MASPEMYLGMGSHCCAYLFNGALFPAGNDLRLSLASSLSFSVISTHMLVTSAGSMSRESFER